MYPKSLVHYLTKILIDILFFGGILALFGVPFFVRWWIGYTGLANYLLVVYNIILYLSAFCALYALGQLRKMFRTLLGDNPFVPQNISGFRKLSVACFLITVIYLIKCVFVFSVPSAVVALAFCIGGLFCLTLKDIFKQAVAFKEENDFTI